MSSNILRQTFWWLHSCPSDPLFPHNTCRKLPIQEFHFSRILQEMNLSRQQFIDLCILLGCDYCGTIKGIGPKKAIDLIKQHGSIEKILDNIDQSVSSHTFTNSTTFKDAWISY